MNGLFSEQKINDRFLFPTFFNEKKGDNLKNERVLSLKGIYSLHCVIEKDIVHIHQEQRIIALIFHVNLLKPSRNKKGQKLYKLHQK